jgi:hypothetical protein
MLKIVSEHKRCVQGDGLLIRYGVICVLYRRIATHRERVSNCLYTFHVTACREILIRVIECAPYHAACAVVGLDRKRRHHIFTPMCRDI